MDFSLCAEYLKDQGLIPVCDSSVGSIIFRGTYPCSHPEYLEIFEHVIFTGMHVLNRLIKDYNNVVWISCGTQFGLPIRDGQECKLADVLEDGRLYGVVGASAFNGGYGALTLYRWGGNAEKNKILENKHAEFRKGVYEDLSASNCQEHPA